MSTSLLYHGFGIRGYQYVRREYVNGEVHFHSRQRREKLRYSYGGGKQVIYRQKFADYSILYRSAGSGRLCLPCPVWECETLRQVQIAFADPRRSYQSSRCAKAFASSRWWTCSPGQVMFVGKTKNAKALARASSQNSYA